MSTWVTGTTVTENSTSVVDNTSNVTIRLIVGWNYGSWAADAPAWYINVNGSRVSSGTANFNTGQLSSGSQQVASWTGNVPHNSDGTGSMSWSVGYEAQHKGEGYETAAGTKTLTTINRYSVFGSVTDINIENSFSFPVTKYLSDATDTLVISSGTFSKTISNYTSGTSISLTSSEKNSLYALNTTGTTVPLTLTLTTTYNSTNIGSDTKTINGTFTATAPTASGTPTNSPSTVYTGYTDVTVSISGMTFTGTKAATIATYKVTLGNITKTSTSKSTSFVFERATSGSLSIDVVDSRGNSLATPVTKSITVVNYTAPTIVNFSVYRSPNPTSTSLKLDISGTYTNNSTVLSGTKLTVKYRLKGSTGSWTNVYNNVVLSSITGMTASGGNYSLSGASISGTFGMTNAYDFEAILNDTNTSVTVTVDISVLTASTTLDIDTNTRRVGIGLFCSTEDNNSLSVAGDIYEGGTKLGNKYAGYQEVSVLPSSDFSAFFNLIYPIGSIYLSTTNANPGTLFGGTWVQIKDTFLLAAGDVYTGGSTGGEAEHTLSVDEMPKHMHLSYKAVYGWSGWPSQTLPFSEYGYVYNYNSSGNTGGGNYSGNSAKGPDGPTDEKGGDVAHNNMPPYLAVYVWRRTA